MPLISESLGKVSLNQSSPTQRKGDDCKASMSSMMWVPLTLVAQTLQDFCGGLGATGCRSVAMSQENHTTPHKIALAHLHFELFKRGIGDPMGGVALKVRSWKVSRYRGVLQVHCRLSHYNGPPRPLTQHIW